MRAPGQGRRATGLTSARPAAQVDASIPQLFPDGYAPAAAAPWARTALAASVRRDDEPSSSSVYAAAQPAAALAAANFSAFVNGEPLRGQDVVAWVTLGAWDLPSAESAPALATPGRRCRPRGWQAWVPGSLHSGREG